MSPAFLRLKPNIKGIRSIRFSQAILGFLFILPFIIVLPSANKTELPQWGAAAAVTALLLLGWLLESKQRISWTPLHTLVAVTTGITLALGSFHAEAPGVQNGMLQQLTLALFFLLGAQFLSSEGGQRQLLMVTVATGSLAAFIGITQHFSGSNLGLPATSSSASVFINKNWAGAFMDLATPAAFILFLAARGRKPLALAAAGFFLCLSFSLITLSRSHWLALVGALTVLLILFSANPALKERLVKNRPSKLLVAALIMLIAPALLMIPPVSTERNKGESTIETKISDSGSITHRTGFYQNTLRMIGDAPIAGMGPGTFYTRFQGYYGDPEPIRSTSELVGVAHAHNDYLEYLAELGIPGGLLMFALLALIWFSAWKMARERRSSDKALMGAAFLVGISAVLGHAMIDFPLSQPAPSIFLWTWAGAISAIWIKDAKEESGVEVRTRLRIPLALLAIAYLGVVSWHGYNALRANILIDQAARLTIKGECKEAKVRADEALSLKPKDYLVWHHMLVVHGACESDIQIQYQQASLVLEHAPSHPYALLVRANALLQAGEYDLASGDYRELTRLLPHRASGYLGLANTLALNGKIPEAQAQYKKADEVIKLIGKQWQSGPAGRELASLTRKVLAYSNQQKAEKADTPGAPTQDSASNETIIVDDG